MRRAAAVVLPLRVLLNFLMTPANDAFTAELLLRCALRCGLSAARTASSVFLALAFRLDFFCDACCARRERKLLISERAAELEAGRPVRFLRAGMVRFLIEKREFEMI